MFEEHSIWEKKGTAIRGFDKGKFDIITNKKISNSLPPENRLTFNRASSITSQNDKKRKQSLDKETIDLEKNNWF